MTLQQINSRIAAAPEDSVEVFDFVSEFGNSYRLTRLNGQPEKALVRWGGGMENEIISPAGLDRVQAKLIDSVMGTSWLPRLRAELRKEGSK